MATIYETGKIYMIPPAEILPNPGQPRKHMDPVRIQELATTAKRVGIVQPITCRQDPVTYLIYNVAGSRRLAAARLAGLTEVPVIFVKDENSDEVAIVENVQRQDLNPVEEAEAFQRFMDEHNYLQDQLADIIGKDQSTVSRTLSLNKLPAEIRDKCRQDPTVPKNVLVEIAQKKQTRSMLTAFRQYEEQQGRIAAKEAANENAGPDVAPAQRKRTPAEIIVDNMGIWSAKIGEVEFTVFTKDERTRMLEAMVSMKDTLEEAITRAEKNKKKPT